LSAEGLSDYPSDTALHRVVANHLKPLLEIESKCFMSEEYLAVCKQIKEIGYAVLPKILTQEEALRYRTLVIEHLVDHGVIGKYCDKMERDALHRAPFMKDLITHPKIVAVARALLGPQFVYAHHSDLQFNKITNWHKDNRGTDDYVANAAGETYSIYKFAFYLQDHTGDDNALAVIPKSHLEPTLSIVDPVRLHPALGDMVVFDQRLTHNGCTPPLLLRAFLIAIRNQAWRAKLWWAMRRTEGLEDRIFVQVTFARPGIFLDQHIASIHDLLLTSEGVRYTVSDEIRSYVEARGVCVPSIEV
jgi:hypothetical protein